MDESLIREQEAQLQKTGRYYKHICFMAVPVLCMAAYLALIRWSRAVADEEQTHG